VVHNGHNGWNGHNGYNGYNGYDGYSGYSGYNGWNGGSGWTGGPSGTWNTGNNPGNYTWNTNSSTNLHSGIVNAGPGYPNYYAVPPVYNLYINPTINYDASGPTKKPANGSNVQATSSLKAAPSPAK